jgi:antitoxin component YwqK of YwqJK toxin-antitoxin module
VYDTSHKYWRLYVFYTNGKIEQTKKLDPVTFRDLDSSFVYHLNGKVAWIFPYTDSGYLSGRLMGYYASGSIWREAYYYRNFRTGTWKEYYSNGRIKSISHYQISNEDSAFFRPLTSRDYQNGFAEPESFTWGEEDFLKIDNDVISGKTKFEFTTLVSKKTGVWKTYDSTGKIVSKTNYKRGMKTSASK